MNTKREDMLRKVKALLAKAGDESVTEAEAASFLAKANELMTEYSINEYDLGCYQKSDLDSSVLYEGKTLPMFHYMWGDLLNRFFHVRVFESACRGRKVMIIYGTPANMEWASYVWHFLVGKANQLWLHHRRYHPELDNKSRSAYYTGLHSGLEEKLIAAKPKSDCRSLVVLDTDLNDSFMDQFGAGLSNQERTVRYSDAETREAGRRDGKDINLARPLPRREHETPRIGCV